MTDRNRNQLARTWIVLVAIVLSGMLAVAFQGRAPVVASAVLVLALIKARLIILDFMGLRSGPAAIRRGLLAWPLILALVAAAQLFITGMPSV
ncbi:MULTISPECIES: cytochrome C oxidase subunit IV family protein [unclassified Sinorhizobium]|uniref:cytochrome C oxidase subunit IV family protein n=1 Tax=unclassified Sinorhizobium TaxID=2613772 RepID=UPI0024C3EAEE|nr:MULTISPECIES: cytochrome C oxidase subunit IV family protein [unclassified Sinorhizobium]MDK1377653.1 cytochrome C oxidase subunit IV family protein [Sinorhizobium sp. 6-70]MDK1482801.1 cytochrome C oxidase subunit IV family protein [Sinorhizobium sp. 6-117]